MGFFFFFGRDSLCFFLAQQEAEDAVQSVGKEIPDQGIIKTRMGMGGKEKQVAKKQVSKYIKETSTQDLKSLLRLKCFKTATKGLL